MRSIIDLPNNYVVIDIETTGPNPRRDKIIELSAIRCRDGKETESYSQLVAVGETLSGFISAFTGITDEMLKGKPMIGEALQDFIRFIGEDILVGHNIANFDSCFIANAYEAITGKELTNSCVDTIRLSKKFHPDWGSYKLQRLAFHYGIPYEGAHRGLNDCRITHECYQRLRSDILGTDGVEAFIDSFKKKNKGRDVKSFIPSSDNFDESNPLYKKVIVFTGSMFLTRAEAIQIAIDAGAVVKTSVTTNTSYLVGGNQDPERVGEDGLSSKEEKAIRFNTEGKAHIEFISEEEFLKLARNAGV